MEKITWIGVGVIMKKRTKFVICSIINIDLFTIVTLLLSAFDKVVPDSLIVAWFAAWTMELALLAGITIKKNDQGDE